MDRTGNHPGLDDRKVITCDHLPRAGQPEDHRLGHQLADAELKDALAVERCDPGAGKTRQQISRHYVEALHASGVALRAQRLCPARLVAESAKQALCGFPPAWRRRAQEAEAEFSQGHVGVPVERPGLIAAAAAGKRRHAGRHCVHGRRYTVSCTILASAFGNSRWKLRKRVGKIQPMCGLNV
jgi:hypothetical protein